MVRLLRAKPLLIAVVATLATVSVGACGSDDAGDAEAGPTRVGITASDGDEARLADFAGSPLVVNMWATWCTPCVEEMPAFDEVATELAGEVTIIGVNVGDTAEDARAFADDLGVTYPQFTDPDGLLSTALGVTQLPATAFLTADGTLLGVHQGAFDADELRAEIAERFPDGGTEK